MPGQWNDEFDAIVIGTGFGGSVAITKMVKQGLKALNADAPEVVHPRILVLERGTWWRNPEGPGLRPQSKKKSSILGEWQYWARPNDSMGLNYVANSIYKAHNPAWDAVNPFFKDNDLGPKKNTKGLYRLTRFSHPNGRVDVVSGSAVGGGSLFYSGVNLIPHKPVLDRIGLKHLTSADFRNAGVWMQQFRGKISKVNTKMPVPQYRPSAEEVAADPDAYYQLGAIPESLDQTPPSLDYEMPAPDLDRRPDGDYLLLDRARVLKRAMQRVLRSGGFKDAESKGVVFRDRFEALPLSIVEYEPPKVGPDGVTIIDDTDANVANTFCTREGRCILGCLPSARHTLYKTIQDVQKTDAGAKIEVLPMTQVSHLDRGPDGKGYTVHFESLLDGEEGKRKRANAPRVFVAAGCLGSTEILLRTRERHAKSGGTSGLPLSPQVGKHFSTNGDFFAFTYDIPDDYKTSSTTPDSERIGNPNPTAGPINSSHFYVVFDQGKQDRVDVNVEDAGVPTTFARLVHGLLPHFGEFEKFIKLAKATVNMLLGRDPFATTGAPDTESRDQSAYLTERELVSGVFFYNLMGAGPDEPKGTFSLQEDGVGLDLAYDDGVKLEDWVVFRRQETVLNQLSKQMYDPGDEAARTPKLMASPFWQDEKRVTVVHPLGGCAIAGSSAKGVVDHEGRAFDCSPGAAPTDVLEGLYVVDASAIPGAIGVNPTFTIVAHAVRCVDRVVLGNAGGGQ